MARSNIYLELIGKMENKLCGMPENSMLPPEQALADEMGVSKPTLRRALQALADAGQIRKINGVGIIVTKRPVTISRELIFVCHDIVFFAETLKNFGMRATELNYFISIVPLTGDAQTQERILLSVAERRPAGVVVYADPEQNQLTVFHQFATAGIPILYMMRLPYGIDGNLLGFGNVDGMTEVVEHFYRQGCRRIALYGEEGLVNPSAAVEREQGFFAGIKKCRLVPRHELYCVHKVSQEKLDMFIQMFTDKDNGPDAVCCLNDQCAGHLIKTLLRRGIDISLVRFSGFDHSQLSDFIPHPLLTVEPPMAELGREAAEMLIRQVENPQFGFQRRKLRSAIINTEK